MSGEIVVGYDGSACAKAALARAEELAQKLGRGLVIAFGYEPATPGGGELADHRHALEDIGTRLTSEASDTVGLSGVKVETAVIDARPADGLVRLAEQHDAEMIVVGTHGEHPIVGSIMGSTPYKLVHRSPIPVLVVPEPTPPPRD